MVEQSHSRQDWSLNVYDISGMPRGEEDAGPNEDDVEMPNAPSDRLLIQSTSALAPDVETERATSRAQMLLLKAIRVKNTPNFLTARRLRPS
jgi:hypothetical protein